MGNLLFVKENVQFYRCERPMTLITRVFFLVISYVNPSLRHHAYTLPWTTYPDELHRYSAVKPSLPYLGQVIELDSLGPGKGLIGAIFLIFCDA